MKTLIWIVTAGVVGLWSLVAWITHGLVGVAGQLVASNADLIPADPLLVEWASWLAASGTGLGEWLVIVVWAFVSLVLLALGSTTFLGRWATQACLLSGAQDRCSADGALACSAAAQALTPWCAGLKRTRPAGQLLILSPSPGV